MKVIKGPRSGIALWSVLYSAATTGTVINVTVPVKYDLVSSPNYGLITISNGGRFVLDRTKDTSIQCAGFLVDTGGEFYAGSKAITASAYGDDPFPRTCSFTMIGTGLRVNEVAGNLSSPGTAVPTNNRAFMAMDGSRVFMHCTKRLQHYFKIAATINVGDTSLTTDRAVTVKAGETIYLSTTKYNSENPALTKSNWDHLITSNYGAEKVIVAADVTAGTTITFIRDPAVVGTGAQFRHFGQLQYVVAKTRSGVTKEDIANTNLSLTDHGILAGDVIQTAMGGDYTGSDALAAFTPTGSLAGERGAGGSRGRVVDHRAVGAILDQPLRFTCLDDTDWWQYGYGFTMMGMGNSSTTIFQNTGIWVYRGGKTGQLGAYPMHHHVRSLPAYPTAFSDLGAVNSEKIFADQCTVSDSSNRGISIHGTNGFNLTDCVFTNVDTHVVFEEDGYEKDGLSTGNVVLGWNRINTQLRVNSAAHSVTPMPQSPIKTHDYIISAAYCGSSSYYYSGIDIINAGISLGGQGPAAFWHANPTKYLKNNIAIGGYVGIWNNYQRKPFGASRLATNNAFRTTQPDGYHDNNEVGCVVHKFMTTNPHVYDEFGNVMSGPDSSDTDFSGDSYQYGPNIDNAIYPSYANREFFTNMNFWKTDSGGYGNEAHDPQYEGWHMFGASGQGYFDDTSHHDRYMTFGNGRPRFRGFLGGPNTLDDPYPDSSRALANKVTMFLSYGAGALEHSGFYIPSIMTQIGAWNDGLPTQNDELNQRGGLMHLWDFYLHPRYPDTKSIYGLCKNTIIAGGSPGVPGIYLPPPFAFAVWGTRFKAFFDPTNVSQQFYKTSRGIQGAIQIPDDGSFFKKSGGWWVYGDSPYHLYNTTGSVYVTPSPTDDVAQTMNGKWLPNTYNFYGLQVQWANGTDNGVLNNQSGYVGAITYARVQADGVTLVTNGALAHPRYADADGLSWYNMRHGVIGDGEMMDISWPSTTDVPTPVSWVLGIWGMGGNFSQFSGAHFRMRVESANATGVTTLEYVAPGATTVNIPVCSPNNLAGFLAQSTMCYWKDTTNNRLYVHVVQVTGGAYDSAYPIAIRWNDTSHGVGG